MPRLNSAYEIVGDDAKRKAFDAGEIDAEGKPVHPAFEGFGAQPGGGFGREGSLSRPSPGDPAALNAAAAAGGRAAGFEDVLKEMFGRAGAAGPGRDFGRGDARFPFRS